MCPLFDESKSNKTKRRLFCFIFSLCLTVVYISSKFFTFIFLIWLFFRNMNEESKMEDSDNQKFCLKWNNFQSNFMSQFEMLKDDEDFVDVTLSCYGQSLKAHKVVLSACSPYLKSLFKENPCKHPVIILDCLTFNNLQAVIQFVYTGQVYVEQAELSSFLKAAEILQIRGLTASSAEQSLVETNLPPVSEKDDSEKVSKKREAEVDGERRSPSKRLASKISCDAIKKEIEYEEKDEEAQDCGNNISEFEGNFECSLNVGPEINANIGVEDKMVTGTSGEEEWSASEHKRPHWLDPRSCPLCNRTYSNLSNLRQHMKLIHNPTLVKCSLCYKTFKTDLYLRRHLISFHELSVNGNNLVNSPVQSQPPPPVPPPPHWNPNIKTEPFNEIINANEMYQVPQ